jgi:hypothetical protein
LFFVFYEWFLGLDEWHFNPDYALENWNGKQGLLKKSEMQQMRGDRKIKIRGVALSSS